MVQVQREYSHLERLNIVLFTGLEKISEITNYVEVGHVENKIPRENPKLEAINTSQLAINLKEK